ncbi:ABC transporter ATP-binding protein [Mesobacillus zeae]|uniref:ABC transporter ATP-binding protein n=1 Tax=Mesobacillus zeae TaxID=1917180 RepID=A0A398BDP2_9BACI|nr:ABC transporter ATP-binding protein [Mesobacillus zeae]RID88295.1 ABC transporter ATP-binding protein [Mesobacillus zeae]
MIKMEGIMKHFDHYTALSDVSLSIAKGSIYGLIGSNGAGKTTLIKLLAGIYRQDKGKVTIIGQPVYENVDVKQKMFYIPDSPVFLSQYTISMMARYYKSLYPNWSDERFETLVKSFAFDVKKKLHTFSKGWQRQAAFILALSCKPDILFLDEPMDGLDPVVRKKVKNLLITDVAEREMSILISSHNLREIEDICDTVGIIHKGKIVLQKELDDLKSDIHKIQIAYRGEVPKDLLKNLSLVHTEKRGSILLCIVRGDEEDIFKQVKKTNPLIFDILPLTLEEIFIYEMGDIGYAIENVIVK